MRKKSPQEKKRDSYLRDRRNRYNENSKASRKAIPKRRRGNIKARRRASNVALAGAAGTIPEEMADQVDARVRSVVTAEWSKTSDRPLAAHAIDVLKRRVKLGIDRPETAARKIEKIRAATAGKAKDKQGFPW